MMETKISCIIVDDEPIAREGLESYITDIDFLELKGTAKNVSAATKLLSDHQIDLMFLDIEMPGITGIDFLKTHRPATKTILTTAFSEYALQGYELEILDYLLKPISFSRFYQACMKAKRLMEQQITAPELIKADYFFVKNNKKFEPILISEILYIEALQNYAIIYSKSKKSIVYISLKEIEQTCCPPHFIKVHKSFIVAINHIDYLTREHVVIENKTIPIGRAYAHHLFNDVIANRLLRRKNNN